MLDSAIENVSRDEAYLHPLLLERFIKFREFTAQRSVDLVPTCTWRSEDKQDFIFQFSRTIPSVMLTKDLGKYSGICLVGKNGNPLSIQLDFVAAVCGKVPVDFKKYSYVSFNCKNFGLKCGLYNDKTSLFLDIDDVIEYEKTNPQYESVDYLLRIKRYRDGLKKMDKKEPHRLDSESHLTRST